MNPPGGPRDFYRFTAGVLASSVSSRTARRSLDRERSPGKGASVSLPLAFQLRKRKGPRFRRAFMTVVRKERLELSRYCYRQPLKLVRLPIPPLSRGGGSPRGLRYYVTDYFFGGWGAGVCGAGAFSAGGCCDGVCDAGVGVCGAVAGTAAGAGVVTGAGAAPPRPRISEPGPR